MIIVMKSNQTINNLLKGQDRLKYFRFLGLQNQHSLRAFEITHTELIDMHAAEIMGFRRGPPKRFGGKFQGKVWTARELTSPNPQPVTPWQPPP